MPPRARDPMRVVFFNRYFWPDASATSQLLTDLAVHFAAGGHDVTVVTSRQRQDIATASLPRRETHRGVAVQRVRATAFGRGHLAGRSLDYVTFYFAAAWFVLLHVRRGDTVVAKTDPPLLGAALAPCVALKRARLVNWLQDVYPEVAERLGVLRTGSWLARALRRVRNGSLRRAQCNVVIGERMRECVAPLAGSAEVRVIHNWSDALESRPVPSADNPYRVQLGLQHKVVFVYSGNLGRAHRFEALLAAGAQLRERTDLHFLIIGDGPKLPAVRDFARSLPNWSFLPAQPRERLAESLGAADVHLVSLEPRLEGLIVPSKVYGVLTAGRPCIFIGATDGEVARLLSAHDCGITVHPDDPEALAQAIDRLAADPALRRRLGASARRAAERHFDFVQAAGQWEALVCR